MARWDEVQGVYHLFEKQKNTKVPYKYQSVCRQHYQCSVPPDSPSDYMRLPKHAGPGGRVCIDCIMTQAPNKITTKEPS